LKQVMKQFWRSLQDLIIWNDFIDS
jgi:hypothetical protein